MTVSQRDRYIPLKVHRCATLEHDFRVALSDRRISGIGGICSRQEYDQCEGIQQRYSNTLSHGFSPFFGIWPQRRSAPPGPAPGGCHRLLAAPPFGMAGSLNPVGPPGEG
jgi:hypothetical protein